MSVGLQRLLKKSQMLFKDLRISVGLQRLLKKSLRSLLRISVGLQPHENVSKFKGL